MKDVKVPAEFMQKGGTELAPMSTTTDLATAMIYSASSSSVLLCLRTNHYMKRGADISFLSAFPAEKEFLFPPLTFLHPVNDAPEVVTLGARTFFVIDVEPVLP